MAETERVICRIDELVDGGRAVRFETRLPEPARDLPCFAVSYDGNVYAYVNFCPHRGTELDWQLGEVFDESGLYLVCATHGALFEPESGTCIAGPCFGDRLRRLPIKLVGNDVVLLGNDVDSVSSETKAP
ncbi:MAG: Rieske 2Fe-2S domain-containing protein [Usitatibacteraceae bacterium]